MWMQSRDTWVYFSRFDNTKLIINPITIPVKIAKKPIALILYPKA
ncbi:hypothetical protein C1A50_2136 [Paenibacillus polymyxa]|nr:hypothetical protein C1A50_2136 [Paenibacillus polymyxa]